MPIDRSPELVKVVYFLNEYARTEGGRQRPPAEFADLNWREVYELFAERLSEGRRFETFKGSAEGLRKGNISEHKDHGLPFLPKYERILGLWIGLSREDQFEEISQWITLSIAV